MQTYNDTKYERLTNIKLGAISPLAGVFKFALKLLIAYYLARYLELVPTACIAGILLFVATNMVKPSEVTEVLHMGRGHTALMIFTAVMVIITDFITGVLSSLVIFGVWKIVEALSVAVAQPAVEHNTVRQHHPKVVRPCWPSPSASGARGARQRDCATVEAPANDSAPAGLVPHRTSAGPLVSPGR